MLKKYFGVSLSVLVVAFGCGVWLKRVLATPVEANTVAHLLVNRYDLDVKNLEDRKLIIAKAIQMNKPFWVKLSNNKQILVKANYHRILNDIILIDYKTKSSIRH